MTMNYINCLHCLLFIKLKYNRKRLIFYFSKREKNFKTILYNHPYNTFKQIVRKNKNPFSFETTHRLLPFLFR